MPAAVLHVPLRERADLSLHVVSRLRLTLAAYKPVARLYALANPGLEEIDDIEFGRLLGETAMSKFLNPTLDPPDREAFAAFLKGDGFLKADFSAMGAFKPLPGIFVAPTVALFRRTRHVDPLVPVAIRVGDRIFAPGDGDAWELAKYFVLQGMTAHMVTGFHARLHFPMDAINAITKSVLPVDHPLFQLLHPHTRFSLALNDRVLEHPRTILENSQEEVYTPFAGPAESVRGLVSTAYVGIPGNSSYPAYVFTLRPPRVPSRFGDFIDAYYEAFLGLADAVARRIPRGDPAVRRWARYISQWIPGFPDEEAIFENGKLARAAAYYVCDVSVMHAADHHSFSSESPRKLPFRLRVPPPSGKKVTLDRRSLVTRDDLFRYKMAHQLFFKPSNLTLLARTRYAFRDPRLRAAAQRLHAELRRVDERFRGLGYIPLSEISRSIQY
jgi:hypothetical protein